MDILEFVKINNLFDKGDIVGVGCSGGSDSVALLHFLAQNQAKFGIEVVAIHINHQIRQESQSDCEFVKKLTESLNIRFYSLNVDVPKLADEKGQSYETVGRDARYKIFSTLREKGKITKLALAHHKNDQAETILMHIFRGSGLTGAKGMEAKIDNFYVRPLLECSKEDILRYLKDNNLSYQEDCTNVDNSYTRNYIRNVVLKEITQRYPGAVDSIVNFGKSVKEDDDYLELLASDNSVIKEDNLIKIPLSYFLYPPSIINRILLKSFKELGITKDIERRHIELLKALANGENGKKINLPFGVKAIKEYDYLSLIHRKEENIDFESKFKVGEIIVPNFGKIVIKKLKKLENEENYLYIDSAKLPKDAVWRFKREGDTFTKFGGGSKKLKSYLIDKKIPSRLRKFIPVLASGNEVYVIAGVEISEKVKVEKQSKSIYSIKV